MARQCALGPFDVAHTCYAGSRWGASQSGGVAQHSCYVCVDLFLRVGAVQDEGFREER